MQIYAAMKRGAGTACFIEGNTPPSSIILQSTYAVCVSYRKSATPSICVAHRHAEVRPPQCNPPTAVYKAPYLLPSIMLSFSWYNLSVMSLLVPVMSYFSGSSRKGAVNIPSRGQEFYQSSERQANYMEAVAYNAEKTNSYYICQCI